MELITVQSIAEIAASVATVLTLIYLALQIRDNTSASKRAALDDYIDRLGRWSTSLRENPDSLRVYMDGNQDFVSMSAEDKLKYHFIMSQLFSYCESALGHAEVDGIKQETMEGTRQLIRTNLSSVGARQWWELLGKTSLARDFAEMVEAEILHD